VVLAPSGSLMDLWSLAQERATRGNSDLPHGRRRGTTSTVLLQRHCGSTRWLLYERDGFVGGTEIAVVGPGSFFGGLSLVDDQPQTATVDGTNPRVMTGPSHTSVPSIWTVGRDPGPESSGSRAFPFLVLDDYSGGDSSSRKDSDRHRPAPAGREPPSKRRRRGRGTFDPPPRAFAVTSLSCPNPVTWTTGRGIDRHGILWTVRGTADDRVGATQCAGPSLAFSSK
jgi:hypothetical protein